MVDQSQRQLVSVMFTDIEGYSALTLQDESVALSFVTRYQQTVTELTEAFNGEIIHFYGDGSLTVHASAIEAVQCAVAIQEALRQEPVVPVRIGIHLGEIVRRGDSIFGNTVNVASRLHNLGPSGSILLSETVAQQFASHPELDLDYIGTETVKNIEEPVKVYAVRGDGLIVPTWDAIHKRNKARSKTSYLIPALVFIAIIVIAGIQILSNRVRLPDVFLDQRVVVLPFENNTGDSSLAFIGHAASRHVSRCLEEAEEASIVSFDHLIRNEQLQQFGFFDMQATIQAVGARNFIEGSYLLIDETTLKFSSALRSGRTLEYIQHFPDVTANLGDFSNGIEELGQRVAGYWLSKDTRPLSVPLQDAYKAFSEGVYHWSSDYDKAVSYLTRSIELDSTFLDAYYFLFDAFSNQFLYEDAAEVFDSINSRFDIEGFSERQLLNHRYYESQINCDNEQAYKVLREMFDNDPEELYTNTAMAVNALHFVNEPEECLEILELIPFDSIDFEINRHARDRISLAIQACFSTEQYKLATRYAAYYPRDDNTSKHLELQARAFAGVRDTAAIGDLLNRIQVTGDIDAKRVVLYALSRDFKLLGDDDLTVHYTQRALNAYAKHQSAIYGHLLFDTGDTVKGLDHFKSFYKSYGAHPLVLIGLARGHAMTGRIDTARTFIALLDQSKPKRFDFGQTEYDQAKVYTYIGAYDDAIIKLEQAISDGLFFSMRQVHNDPDLIPLFHLPDYDTVVHPLRD